MDRPPRTGAATATPPASAATTTTTTTAAAATAALTANAAAAGSTGAPDRPTQWQLLYRMTCEPCQVAWTGEPASRCWVCDGPGTAGPPPLLFPVKP